MKLPLCIYGNSINPEQLARDIARLYSDLHDLTDGRIDGFNLADNLVGSGLQWSSAPTLTSPISVGTRTLVNTIANTSISTYFRPKGDGLTPETFYGMELVLDEDSTTDGFFCIVDKDALTTQHISLRPLVSSKSQIVVNGRVGQFGTISANNIKNGAGF